MVAILANALAAILILALMIKRKEQACADRALVKLFQDLVVCRRLVAVDALATYRLVAVLFVAGAVANALYGRQAVGKCWRNYLNLGTTNLLLSAI